MAPARFPNSHGYSAMSVERQVRTWFGLNATIGCVAGIIVHRFGAMAETAERAFVNRIGESNSCSLGFLAANSSGRPRLSDNSRVSKTLVGENFRFIFASFVKVENLQLLESADKMAARPFYGRHDNKPARTRP